MFWMGYLCQTKQEIINMHHTRLLLVSFASFLILLTFWSGRLTIYMIPISFIDWNNGIINYDNLGITLYRMSIGIAGSMVFFLASPWVYDKISEYSFTTTLNNLGKCTLGLYWVQNFLLECTLHGIGYYVGTTESFIIGPILAMIELTLCYQVVLLLKKNSFTRLFFLREKKFQLISLLIILFSDF